MTLDELQLKLDIEKWTASEKANKDLCGELDYCAFCKAEQETPCANAFNAMQAKKATEKKPVAKKATTKKATAEKKPAAEKKTAAKSTSKKAAK